MKLEFGKYRGQDLMVVPRDYVEWLIESREKDLAIYKAELVRRDQAEAADQTDVEKIVQAGYRALVMKAHPDHGGSTNEFLALKNAKAQLDQILAALKTGQG